jgi:hypothetical protein
MADQDQASTEPAPDKVLNPVPVTASRETERPAGLAFDVEKAPTCPGSQPGTRLPRTQEPRRRRRWGAASG